MAPPLLEQAANERGTLYYTSSLRQFSPHTTPVRVRVNGPGPAPPLYHNRHHSSQGLPQNNN
jgi:hypothetical protein